MFILRRKFEYWTGKLVKVNWCLSMKMQHLYIVRYRPSQPPRNSWLPCTRKKVKKLTWFKGKIVDHSFHCSLLLGTSERGQRPPRPILPCFSKLSIWNSYFIVSVLGICSKCFLLFFPFCTRRNTARSCKTIDRVSQPNSEQGHLVATPTKSPV